MKGPTKKYMPKLFNCCNARASREVVNTAKRSIQICRCGNLWDPIDSIFLSSVNYYRVTGESGKVEMFTLTRGAM